MPTVFVTQVPHKRDPISGDLIPIFNIAMASEHGDVRVMVAPIARFPNADIMTQHLVRELADYNVQRGDSLLTLGDAAVAACAVAIVAQRGPFGILRWDRIQSRYLRVPIIVPPPTQLGKDDHHAHLIPGRIDAHRSQAARSGGRGRAPHGRTQ